MEGGGVEHLSIKHSTGPTGPVLLKIYTVNRTQTRVLKKNPDHREGDDVTNGARPHGSKFHNHVVRILKLIKRSCWRGHEHTVEQVSKNKE